MKFENFTKNLVTFQDLNTLLRDIEEAETAIFEVGSAILSKKLENKVSDNFEEALRQVEREGLLPKSQQGKQEFFKELKSHLLSLPKVKMELAFDPEPAFVKKISEFVGKSLNSPAVLDISVKPAIIAGATIEFNGMFKDYSYKDKLEQVLGEKLTPSNYE